MANLLTPEEMAERYCLQECPGGCSEPQGRCMDDPGHLHDHHHSVYDYLGSGSHSWQRLKPTEREIAAYLKSSPEAFIDSTGATSIPTAQAARLLMDYLKSFESMKSTKPKRRGLFRSRQR